MKLTDLLTGSIIGLVACGGTGPYVWIDSINPAADATQNLVLRDGDNVNVRVFNHDNLSTQQRVRADGKISIPVVGEVAARGKQPLQLARELEEKLKAVVVAPSVSVTVEQAAQIPISVVGEVKQGGTFQVEHGSTVLHALASAGGLSDFADGDKVFVVRKGMQQRVRFRYQDLRAGDPRSNAFLLQAGDIVVVE